MRQDPDNRGTVVMRVPEDVARTAAQLAAMRGVTAGAVVAEAWREYVSRNGEALAAVYEAAAQSLREGVRHV